MLVYYKSLSPALQDAVRQAKTTPDTIESLAALAEHVAMSGMMNTGDEEERL